VEPFTRGDVAWKVLGVSTTAPLLALSLIDPSEFRGGGTHDTTHAACGFL